MDVPNGKSKHAAEFLDTTLSIFLVRMQDDLGVCRGVKLIAILLEFRTELGGVITFSVVVDPELAVGAVHRLMASSLRPMMAKRVFTRKYDPRQCTPWRSGPRCDISIAMRSTAGRNAAHEAYPLPVASRQRSVPRACLDVVTGSDI